MQSELMNYMAKSNTSLKLEYFNIQLHASIISHESGHSDPSLFEYKLEHMKNIMATIQIKFLMCFPMITSVQSNQFI